ncbi:hypothetical protein MBLNU230_g1657t1 [Neophaeotheca triangularis]
MLNISNFSTSAASYLPPSPLKAVSINRLAMHLLHLLPCLSGLAPTALSQLYDTANFDTALVGTLNTTNPATLGNYYNHWQKHTTANGTLYDLTRSNRMPTSTPKTIPMLGKREKAVIEPQRTALVIVDMQNYFLHPQLRPNAQLGRAAVGPTLDMIRAFRANGMKVLWLNWGLTDYDLVTIPPSFLEGFASDGSMDTTFGTDMGVLTEDDGTEVQMGRKLTRGAWNARPWGELWPAMVEGLDKGTDLHFDKNRLSGLWGSQTPLGLWLQENGLTTLFFGGVNSDQCVWGTLIDAYYKGFDTVYVEDCAATVSPWYAEQMVRYNADLNGFRANSTHVVEALKRQE